MSHSRGIERAMLRLLQALEEIVREPKMTDRKLQVILPVRLARVLAAGRLTCFQAVEQAASDYVDAWSTEQLVDDLTGELLPNGDNKLSTLLGNLRIRVRHLRRSCLQLLRDLRVEVRDIPQGAPFDPVYHQPKTETVPATAADEEGTIAQMHTPAFVWREEGQEQVIAAEVTLYGPCPEQPQIVPLSPQSNTKRKRRSRQKSA